MAEDTQKKDPLWKEIYHNPHRSDELDLIMWGGAGIPSPDSSETLDDNATGRVSPSASSVSQEGEDRPDGEDAGERTHDTTPQEEEDHSTHEMNGEEESVRASCIVWKKRSGLGKYYKGYMHNAWEQRRVAVAGTKVVYYAIEAGEEGNKVVRGTLDLVEERCSVRVLQPCSSGAPTDYEIDIESEDEDIKWRFCFDSKEVQMSFLEVLHEILTEAGIGVVEDFDSERFEHMFEAGDHIFRWEMIIFPPVIYPIQIHGIVLEAGRNCVIVADFGMTGYSKKEGSSFNHADDHNEKDMQESIVAAWKKFRPKEDQRLNIVTLTDPKEIRKWTRAHYGKSFAEKKDKKKKHRLLGKITSFFGSSPPKAARASSTALKGAQKSAIPNTSNHKQSEDKEEDVEKLESLCDEKKEQCSVDKSMTLQDDKPPMVQDATAALVNGSERSNHRKESTKSGAAAYCDGKGADLSDSQQFDVPEWFDGDGKGKEAEQSVFSIPSSRKAEDDLPKSDPKKIVLARTNFLLEFGEEVLPPYHVFFSNSECIAVWCKTGRWSTLQTAVYLTTQSVAGAKSSTAAVLGVAAAHAFLAPVVALGGLVWVTAPMVILQKSREKWEDATMKLTELFWAWAGPEIFVEAIESWSDLH